MVEEYRLGDAIGIRFGWELALSNMRKEYLYAIVCLAHELYVVAKAYIERYLQFCTVHRDRKASRRWKA